MSTGGWHGSRGRGLAPDRAAVFAGSRGAQKRAMKRLFLARERTSMVLVRWSDRISKANHEDGRPIRMVEVTFGFGLSHEQREDLQACGFRHTLGAYVGLPERFPAWLRERLALDHEGDA